MEASRFTFMPKFDRKFFDLSKAQYPQIGPDLYWILGMGMRTRHATAVRPGAHPAGEWIPAECGEWIRVPCSTPYGQTPRSQDCTEQCPDCRQVAEGNGSSAVQWDF